MYRHILTSFLLVFLLSSKVWGATYYVNYTGGVDSNPGTEALPWQNYSKTTAIAAGDTLLFANGEVWEATGTINTRNGTSSAYTTYGNYGSGELPKFTSTATMPFIWYAPNRHHIIFQNLQLAGQNTTTTRGDIFIDGCNNISVIGLLSNQSLAAVSIDFYQQDSTGRMRDIIVENCTFLGGGESDSLRFDTVSNMIADNITANNNTFDHVLGNAIRIFMSEPQVNASAQPRNFILTNNTFNVTDFCAFSIHAGSQFYIANNKAYEIGDPALDKVNAFQLNNISDTIVENNIIRNVYTSLPDGVGIILDYGWTNNGKICTNVTVRNNMISGCNANSGVGAITFFRAKNCTAYNNIIFDSGRGIHTSGGVTRDNYIYNNVIYNTSTSNINVQFGSNNITIKNNILSTTRDTPSWGVKVWSDSYDVTEDYNVFYGYITEAYNDTRGDITIGSHSMELDPNLKSDYSTPIASPAYNNGTDVGVRDDYLGHPRPIGGGYDIGCFEFGTVLNNATLQNASLQ